MTKAREAIEFACIMCQEYPRSPGLAETLQELMRLSRRHCRLQEKACNGDTPADHDARCEAQIIALCDKLPGCTPVFSGDPRGCTVKLKVPSGRTNDWGATGVCVPQ